MQPTWCLVDRPQSPPRRWTREPVSVTAGGGWELGPRGSRVSWRATVTSVALHTLSRLGLWSFPAGSPLFSVALLPSRPLPLNPPGRVLTGRSKHSPCLTLFSFTPDAFCEPLHDARDFSLRGANRC